MKIFPSLLALLLFLAGFSSAQAQEIVDCSQYQASHSFADVPITLNYVVTEDVFSAEVVYEGQGYIAWGISPNGRMRGSAAVVGLPEEEQVLKYNLGGYTNASVTPAPSDQHTLLSGTIQQNETHTVMKFSKKIKEEDGVEIITDTGYNYFLVAAGDSNSLGYHAHRATVGLRVETCQPPEEETPLEPTGSVDCSQYQYTHSFQNLPLTLSYVVSEDAVLSAQVIYEGQGYVAWGISPDGRMGGSMAVVGLPGSGTVHKYFMSGYTQDSVALLGPQEQTLLSGSVQQNETHTVLTFSKYLQEEDGLEIIADGTTPNYFLVAAGPSNDAVGFHSHRASIGLPLQVCQQGAPVSESISEEIQAVEITVNNQKSLFQAHGWTAALAWGILAPLAINSALCRHLLPKAGLWFSIHFYANILVLVLTLISLALAYAAIQQTEGGNHFETSQGAMGKHRTLGLVVSILVVVQAIAGMVRPSAASKDAKSSLRVLWEISHRVSGLALLGMAYYQCHSGLVLYAQRFVQSNDYVAAFWVVTGIIVGLGVLGRIHKALFVQEASAEEDSSPDSDCGSSFKNDMTENPTEVLTVSRKLELSESFST